MTMTMSYEPPATLAHAPAPPPALLAPRGVGVDPAVAAMQAQASATVQARYVLARSIPRSWDHVRQRVLEACKRRTFADVAVYAKPQGGQKIRGPSVRLADEFFRVAGNLDEVVSVVYDDTHKRTLRVVVTDLETNASRATEITVEKTVERRDPRDRAVVGSRLNTAGETVYVVAVTDDELAIKANALAAKARRNLILSLVPSDFIEEALAQCADTVRGAARDTAGERKRLVDAFAPLGVLARDLEEYVGHSLEALRPDEVVELREAYATLKDGEARWPELLAAKLGVDPTGAPPAATTDAPKRSRLADKVRAGRAARAAEAPAPAAPVPSDAAAEPEGSPLRHGTAPPVDAQAPTEPAPEASPEPEGGAS